VKTVYFDKCIEKIGKRTRLENNRINLSLLEWSPDAVLLDCGCNEGEFTLEVAEKIGTRKIYGIDLLPENVMKAGTKEIKAYEHDLNKKLPFSDEFFDVIHARLIIEHLSDTDMFIRELHRVLKFGGYAVLSTPNLSSIHIILYLILGKQPPVAAVSDEVVVGGLKALYFHVSPGPAHRRLFTLSALTGLCEYYGFRVEKSRGSGFYPFPPFIARVLAGTMKTYSSHISIKIRKSVPDTVLS
jgi:ubiquinone/menaquinone biosynthesis C-methylase UbiE